MNLFLCSTPLQLKIALRIIESEELSHVVLIFTGIMPNKRSSYYLAQAESLVEKIYYFDKNIELKKSRSDYLNKMAQNLIKEYSLKDVADIYMANLNDRFYHHLLSILPYQDLYTFDDGTENVNPFSKFYRNKRYSWLRKAYQRRNGRRYWLDEVLSETKGHYTIYQHLPNVVANTRYIPLYEEIETANVKAPMKKIHILLGTVYRDVVAQRQQASMLIAEINRYSEKNPFDLYLPHPREETPYFENCKTLVPDQMSEELIINYLEQGYEIFLYGFGGSTQLNLDGVKNLTNCLFESDLLSERVRNGYTLFRGNIQYLSLG